MPRRTSLRDRLNSPTPRGREAIYSTATPEGSATDGAAEPPARWEDAHKRVTFYCSMSMLEAVEAEMKRSDRTKTQVIVDALSDHLRPDGRSPKSAGRSRTPRP